MSFISWLALIGAVLMVISLTSTYLKRLPITGAMLYLGLGLVAGPLWLGLIRVDPIGDANWLERVAEIVLIVSVFVGGLKLRLPLNAKEWVAAYRLAGPVMLVSIAGVTAFAYFVLGLSPAAALFLGAVLAPTDPVLASEVTVSDAKDRDRMRYALSGEAGLNDGAAFPFVVLALLLVEHNGQLGSWLTSWALERLLWAVPVGLGLGYVLGWAFGRLAIAIRQRSGETAAAHDLLMLALVLLAYSAAEFVHGWGLLAVFAAGLGLRRAEVVAGKEAEPLAPPSSLQPHDPSTVPAEALVEREILAEESKHPLIASGQILREVLSFGEALERLMSVAIVVLVGALVSVAWDWRGVLVAAVLFFVIRPLGVAIGLIGTPTDGRQRLMIAWFGLRGIGTLYYLAYAVGEGIGRSRASDVWGIAITVVACSIVVHGVSVTPLLNGYERALERRKLRRTRGQGFEI